MKKEYIYPKTRVRFANFAEGNRSEIQFFSYVRLKHRGKWYLCPCLHSAGFNHHDPKPEEIAKESITFNDLVYRVSLLTKVDPKLIHNGQSYFPLDPNQEDEKERIKNQTPLNLI